MGEKILKPIVGRHNTSEPSEGEIVGSNFNSWVAHKRLVIAHEIYAGDSKAAYNRLKNLITEQTVRVNVKFKEEYEIRNWVHILACSNSLRALQLDTTDRRWLIPRVTETKKPTEYWVKLNRWLFKENGHRIIRNWADHYVIDHPIPSGEEAPDTERKREMIEAGYSSADRMLVVLAEALMNREHPTVVRSDEICTWLDGELARLYAKVFPTDGNHVAKFLKDHGAHRGPRRYGKTRFRVLGNFEITTDHVWETELKPLCVTPSKLWNDHVPF